jgi:S-(hydroxymethyl)glutathione dehydrogenase/alcohol dehydrogenase
VRGDHGRGAAIKSARVRFGDTVAVIGCGGMGLSTIQGAAVCEALRNIAIDLSPSRLELASRFGATDTVNAAEIDPVAAVLELTGGRGVHHSFEVVGSQATAQQALDVLRKGGTAYLIGVHPPESHLSVNPFTALVLRQRSMHGVNMGSTNFRHDVPIYAEMYLQGRFNLGDVVTRHIDLDQVNDAYRDLESGAAIRSVITL